ncbi:MAG: DUF2490 domain-containing protein [Pelobium sp.]
MWGASINSFKLSEHTGLHFDIQFRSADEVSYLRNMLMRPGFTYFFNDKNNATVGYAFIFTDQGPAINHNLIEHRIWEQFVTNVKVGKISVTNRLRLEQRFVETNTAAIFTQRLRYFRIRLFECIPERLIYQYQ